MDAEMLVREAMAEAARAIEAGNAPFGALIVNDGEILARAHNTENTDCDITAHAEMHAIRKASELLRSKCLDGCILVSNAESCSMCMSAAVKAGINRYIFGAKSEGSLNPAISVLEIAGKSKQKLDITAGVLEVECRKQILEGRLALKCGRQGSNLRRH